MLQCVALNLFDCIRTSIFTCAAVCCSTLIFACIAVCCSVLLRVLQGVLQSASRRLMQYALRVAISLCGHISTTSFALQNVAVHRSVCQRVSHRHNHG